MKNQINRFETRLSHAATETFIVLFLILITVSVTGQTKVSSENQDPVYKEVDRMPLFKGKDAGEFSNWVANEIKYPAEAIKKKIIGNVVVTFIVEKDGSVSNVKVLKSVPSLDEEAVRVISGSPEWTPGFKDGKPVRVSFVIPVNFRATFPSDEKLRVKG